MHRIEQAILRKFWVKDETDETAFKPVVNTVGKGLAHIRVRTRLIVLVDQVQTAAGIIGEAAAIGKFADVADPRPSCRRHVLIGRTEASSVGKADNVPDLDGESALLDPRRNWVAGNLAVDA